MTIHKKKILHIVISIILIVVAVIYLYPSGSRLLKNIRNYNFFPKDGKELIYSYIGDGDIRIADEILQNKYEISRFKPVEITKNTWKEDPYSDLYWRFNYYNFEPIRNLLFAWTKTNNPIYKDKLIEITESFIDNGIDGPHSWDLHGTAFRTMTLIDVREKLLKKHKLSKELDVKILQTLKTHGEFLADPNHFENDYNHGLDQATALYLLAVNYPDMEGSNEWLKLSSSRINEMLTNIVDDDGILVENSPYYHLYVLEKFWEINKYLKRNHLKIDGFSTEKIEKMISYVAYILQPDLTVPTIGASLKQKVNLFGPYKEMAINNPELLYVLTNGKEGKKPAKLNIQYPSSGQTIMRSGWGKGDNFANQTQLIFDVGNYRTNHSDLDALSFNLFGNGIPLMPDAGLYTYEEGVYRSYFHGTRSHNTVVVDGKDQLANTSKISGSEKVYSGNFKEGDGYVYQSGESELYKGVSHQRAITMIEDSTILIFDNLKSAESHTYEQMFHLYPDAKLNISGLDLQAKWNAANQTLSIQQFITNGVELNTTIDKQNPTDGICSTEYKVAIPCYSISYKQKGQNVAYITAIQIGEKKDNINYDKDNKSIIVDAKNGKYNIKIEETQTTPRTIEVNKGNYKTSQIYSETHSINTLNNYGGWQKIDGGGNGENGESITTNTRERSLEITTPSDGSYYGVVQNTNLNLTNQNIYFKIKINQNMDLQGLDLYLSNNNWTKYARFNVEGSNYDISRNGEWLQFGVGKGDVRKEKLGNWIKNDPTFDWSKVDSIKFIAASKSNKNVAINIKDFLLTPDQKEARAVIVFDDGWSTVLKAANIMNKYELKGNVAVISNSVGKKNYLKLDELKELQNVYGWNLASHSSLHKNAVQTYTPNKLISYEKDIVDALQYMIQNNINSAPNWYIYPDGSTNGALKKVIEKYYKFARATINIPEVYPFSEPLEVGVFPVYSDRTEVVDVHNAIRDAVKYRQTIFLMFHKFTDGPPTVFTEYSLTGFDAILKDIKNQGIKVVTLSELDKENGIPNTDFTIHDFVPPQFNLEISSSQKESESNVIINTWNYIKNITTKN